MERLELRLMMIGLQTGKPTCSDVATKVMTELSGYFITNFFSNGKFTAPGWYGKFKLATFVIKLMVGAVQLYHACHIAGSNHETLPPEDQLTEASTNPAAGRSPVPNGDETTRSAHTASPMVGSQPPKSQTTSLPSGWGALHGPKLTGKASAKAAMKAKAVKKANTNN